MILYQTHDIDWFDVLEHLIDGEAIKIYCHNSLETLTIWGVDKVLITQNSMDTAAVIHDLRGIDVTVNGKLLEVLVDTSLIFNHVGDVSLIETVDFEISLISLD